MSTSINPDRFLLDSENAVLLDVRSPSEFGNGHIPNAISFPIFNDNERAIIGTLYKQKGKNQAILEGLAIVGPKLKDFGQKALELFNQKQIFLYCWRGGMRSSSMTIFLETLGIECVLLKGGYKAYRNYILTQFQKPYLFKVIGGQTGSGKTQILIELNKGGEQIINLEAIAHHKGSAFGRIEETPQPSTEQFGNNLYEVLSRLSISKTIWLEDESQTIGSVFIPTEFYANYRQAPLIVLQIPFEKRLLHLLSIYGNFELSEIINAFKRITRKLGGQNLNMALEYLDNGDLKSAASIALIYYDKAYLYGLQNKDTGSISYLEFESFDIQNMVNTLLNLHD